MFCAVRTLDSLAAARGRGPSGGGEGFFEDGLEEVGGVGATVFDLFFQRTALTTRLRDRPLRPDSELTL